MKRTKPGEVSLKGMVLRLFKAGRSFQESINLQERDAHVGIPRHIYYDHQRRNAKGLRE